MEANNRGSETTKIFQEHFSIKICLLSFSFFLLEGAGGYADSAGRERESNDAGDAGGGEGEK